MAIDGDSQNDEAWALLLMFWPDNESVAAEGKIDRTFVGPNSVAIRRTIGRGRMQGSAELL